MLIMVNHQLKTCIAVHTVSKVEDISRILIGLNTLAELCEQVEIYHISRDEEYPFTEHWTRFEAPPSQTWAFKELDEEAQKNNADILQGYDSHEIY